MEKSKTNESTQVDNKKHYYRTHDDEHKNSNQ